MVNRQPSLPPFLPGIGLYESCDPRSRRTIPIGLRAFHHAFKISSPASPRSARILRTTVSRVFYFLGVRTRMRMPSSGGVSFKWPNQRPHRPSGSLFLHSRVSRFLPSRCPLPGPPRTAYGQPAAQLPPRLLSFLSAVYEEQGERVERRGTCALTSAVETRRRGRGLRAAIKGPWCAHGRLSAAGYRSGRACRCGLWRPSKLAGKGKGLLRPRQGRAAAVGPPAPASGPKNAGRGPGGPAPGRTPSW